MTTCWICEEEKEVKTVTSTRAGRAIMTAKLCNDCLKEIKVDMEKRHIPVRFEVEDK